MMTLYYNLHYLLDIFVLGFAKFPGYLRNLLVCPSPEVDLGYPAMGT